MNNILEDVKIVNSYDEEINIINNLQKEINKAESKININNYFK